MPDERDAKPDGYLIWSHEHSAWWGPGRAGYVASWRKAGIYSYSDALNICGCAIPGNSAKLGALPELPVRRDHVRHLAERFRGAFPKMPPEPWE